MKYKNIASTVRRRIAAGDYSINTFPGEVQLAEEMGVSRRTIRRALQDLIDEGMLTRAPSRRLVVDRTGHHPGALKLIGFLAPCYASLYSETCRVDVERTARERNFLMRTVDFMHDDDPVITDALEGLDGVFVMLGASSSQQRWTNRLRNSSVRAAFFDFDLSKEGILSIIPNPSRWVEVLLEHLRDLGHRRIDCLNVQPIDTVISRRIDVWRGWCDRNRVEGSLISEPVAPFVNPYAQAIETVERLIQNGELKASALLCTTETAAMAAARALANKGLRIGKDLSLCCTNEEALARYFIPSLTTMAKPELRPFIDQCLDWMGGSANWKGPKRLNPAAPELFLGESTAPPPKQRGRRPANAG